MPYDARSVANFLLNYADERSVSVTLMGLLKVLYFAHGWYLAQHGNPLIKNDFEAWQHGPVLRVVYDAFKGIGSSPIRGRVHRIDPVTRKESVADETFSEEDANFLRGVFDEYGHVQALTLSDMTHEPGSPWHAVWHAPREHLNLGMKISNDAIRRHFMSVAEKLRQ